jgi:ribosomal protein S18 acetylase RimI-like enzyme
MRKGPPRIRSEPVRVRAARPADFPELLRLIRAYYRYDGIRFRAKVVAGALRRMLRNSAFGQIWIMRDGVRAIGYVAFSFHYDVEFGGPEGVITDLFIRSGDRRRGLGTRLLATVDDYCRSAGIRSMELQVIRGNRAAEAFYRKHGFKKLARTIMARELP